MMKYETNQMNNSTSKGYISSPRLLTLFNKCASTREVLAFNNVHVERGVEILQGPHTVSYLTLALVISNLVCGSCWEHSGAQSLVLPTRFLLPPLNSSHAMSYSTVMEGVCKKNIWANGKLLL